MDLVLATRNRHKTREFGQILGSGFEVSDLSDRRNVPAIEETGQTFVENAVLKAVAASKAIPNTMIVADDSGLEVDALAGAPGVLSTRYAGEIATDRANIDKLLTELSRERIPPGEHGARFCCALALANNGKLIRTFEGAVEGKIAGQVRGTGGFGYDPIFVPDGFNQTFAELPGEIKNRISHRAKAIFALRVYLSKTPQMRQPDPPPV